MNGRILSGGPINVTCLVDSYVVGFYRLHHPALSLRLPGLPQFMRLFLPSVLLVCFGFAELSGEVIAPVFSPGGGFVTSPALITIANSNGAGAIFYTTDGSDPMDVFGHVTPGARIYEGPVTVNRPTTMRARSKIDNAWSDVAASAFSVDRDFSQLLFTEVMYHAQDHSEANEYVELKNIGTKRLSLAGLHFHVTEGQQGTVHYDFGADASIGPGEFLVLVNTASSFQATYPLVPIHGQYTGQFANSLGRLVLRTALNAEVTGMSYESAAPWQVVPDNHGYYAGDGIGFSLVRVNEDPQLDPASPSTWRASSARSGSPGADEPAPVVPPIYINELLTRSATGARDAVEFFNPNSFAVDLGGWWLADERNDPYRYRIPTGTIVPAAGYLVIDDSKFGTGLRPIAFDSDGERCYLFSGDAAGNLTGYSHGLQFDASEADVTFGRYITSDGIEHFPPQTARTFGEVNTGPKISPVVISEIMYRPQPGAPQFVELRNTTNEPIPLVDPLNSQAAWQLAWNYLGVTLPPGTVIPAQGHVVLATESATAFRARYNVPADVPIIPISPGNFVDNVLVRLIRPFKSANGSIRFLEVEQVNSRDRTPWPNAVVPGVSIERINPATFANDPANWRVSPTLCSPGAPNTGNLPPAVWAGMDRVEFAGSPTPLGGAVADDRWSGASPICQWSQLSGPLPVQFDDASHPQTNVTFPVPGQYVLRLLANDGVFVIDDTVSIQVTPRPFSVWQSSFFSSAELANTAICGPTADPDGDGRSNLHEYFFATHPRQAKLESGPIATIVDGHLQIQWKERSGIIDIVVRPERADRIEGPWFDATELFTSTRVPQGALNEVTASERLPMGQRALGFIRLRVSLR